MAQETLCKLYFLYKAGHTRQYFSTTCGSVLNSKITHQKGQKKKHENGALNTL